MIVEIDPVVTRGCFGERESMHEVLWSWTREVVVFIDESTQEATTFGNIPFPKLESIKLSDLPNLKRFCAGDCVDCSSLLKLIICKCPKL